MAEAFDLEKYRDRIQQLAMEHLSAASGPDDLMKMIGEVAEIAEDDLETHREHGHHIDCRAGCGTCCALNVAVLFPEVVNIVEYVNTRMSPESRREVQARLAELFTKVRWLDDEERIFLQQRCAFLDDSGSCSIYPVRPLICRSITSIDASHCEKALRSVGGEVEHPIVMNMFQKSLMDQTFIAVADALTELGFDDRSGQLTVGTHRLLETPDLAESFLKRKEVWCERPMQE